MQSVNQLKYQQETKKKIYILKRHFNHLLSDIVATVSPYQPYFEKKVDGDLQTRRRESLMLFSGIKNILKGAIDLFFAIVFSIAFIPVTLLLDVIKAEDIQNIALHNFVNPVLDFLNSAVCLLRGIGQVVCYPLLLLRWPVREIITYFSNNEQTQQSATSGRAASKRAQLVKHIHRHPPVVSAPAPRIEEVTETEAEQVQDQTVGPDADSQAVKPRIQ